MKTVFALAFVLTLSIGCRTTSHTSMTHDDPTQSTGRITVKHITSQTGLVALGPISSGEFRVHLIDVGTGLAILVQGNDFNLLFDGGSSDDARSINKGKNLNRLVAYLWTAIGASGPALCLPEGDNHPQWNGGAEKVIDHVVLSHPHQDHASLLDAVFACYQVNHFWTGVTNDAEFYKKLWQQIATEKGSKIMSVLPAPTGNRVRVRENDIQLAEDSSWLTFQEGQALDLGQKAQLRVLHVNPQPHQDFNRNSTVMLVELDGIKLLLTGDAESGERQPPSTPAGDIEQYLITKHQSSIAADILQVGHHGSITSSRLEFLSAVRPKYALVSAGPKKFGSVVLPDQEVIDALNAVGATILRTDQNDAGCPVQDKFGMDDDRPGGCDNYVLIIKTAPALPR